MSRVARPLFFLFIISAAFIAVSCDSSNAFRLDFSPSPPPFDTTQAVSDTTLPGNVKVYTIKKGRDTFQITSQDQPLVKFTARTANGKIVDGTYMASNGPNFRGIINNLTPFARPNPLGGPAIPPSIKGLRKGLIGMKVGAKRTIVIPPDQGYGTNRRGPNGFDVRDNTLIYDVELLGL